MKKILLLVSSLYCSMCLANVPSDAKFNAVRFDDTYKIFIAIGDGGRIATSKDGLRWQLEATPNVATRYSLNTFLSSESNQEQYIMSETSDIWELDMSKKSGSLVPNDRYPTTPGTSTTLRQIETKEGTYTVVSYTQVADQYTLLYRPNLKDGATAEEVRAWAKSEKTIYNGRMVPDSFYVNDDGTLGMFAVPNTNAAPNIYISRQPDIPNSYKNSMFNADATSTTFAGGVYLTAINHSANDNELYELGPNGTWQKMGSEPDSLTDSYVQYASDLSLDATDATTTPQSTYVAVERSDNDQNQISIIYGKLTTSTSGLYHFNLRSQSPLAERTSAAFGVTQNDQRTYVIVGKNNQALVSTNGGQSWQLVTM